MSENSYIFPIMKNEVEAKITCITDVLMKQRSISERHFRGVMANP